MRHTVAFGLKVEDHMARNRLVIAIVGIAVAASLAGCGSKTVAGTGGLSTAAPAVSAPVSSAATTASTPTSAGTPTGKSTPTSGSTPTTGGTATAKSSTTSGADASAVADAKTQWKAGAAAISADQGLYWLKAAADLATAGSAYLKQVSELTELATLPDAQQTTAENKEYHADINALNTFFGTPGLYS